ncbi:MAG: glycoside hydrolase family 3 C-terminal domain-containing protein [Elusimicrobia bacterium]|nr:glycoside hydrolase family 3 C-terminal domain-containing protein [Elusimicrobiota bacterium]
MRIPLLLAFLLASLPAFAAMPKAEVERRVQDLLGKMTLEEKLGQLQQLDGSAAGDHSPELLELARKGRLGSTLNVRGAKRVNELQRAALQSRLKIPVLFAFDVIHGYRTIFPIPLGEAAAWDPAGAERTAAIAAAEAAAAGVRWTFAPMVDIARDPRWGRVAEGAGEDVHLGSVLAAARVRGFQGADPSAPDKVLACAKHWVGYGAAEGGRDYNTTDISEERLRGVYLPPFKAAVDAGVETFMSAFNDLNGVPSSANRRTLTGILRGEWGFDGLVVSDYTSVAELVNHGYAADGGDAARKALSAGVDMEMVSRLYNEHGKTLASAEVDEAVRRVLRVKLRAGIFERPFADEKAETVLLSAPFRDEARLSAARSMVLLENRGVLPFSKDMESLAVLGALADSRADLLGSWTGDGRAQDAATIREALREALPKTRLTDSLDDAAAAVVVVGETFDVSGEAASRSDIGLPSGQLELVRRAHESGKPYAVVLITGRPLAVPWLAENARALLLAWQPGTEGARAVADILLGDAVPGGKLPASFPRSVGQVPVYYAHKNSGRPYDAASKYTTKYLDLPNTPLYPFGYGLSYSSFELSGLAASDAAVSVDVKNTGARAGDEVVQVYVRGPAGGALTRPVRELQGFQRVTLAPGEKRRLDFALRPDAPGPWQVFVGTSSVGGLTGSFVHK